MSAEVAAGTREQVLDAVRRNDRFLLVTHENPDRDALGPLVAMHGVLRLLDKDALMYVAADEFPLPYEYRFFELEGGSVTDVPSDLCARVVIFLDCGNIDRAPEALRDPDLRILNVDHQDLWQRATLAAAVVGGSQSAVEQAADRVERFLDARLPQGVRVERTVATFEEIV